jgi:DNA-binding Lrp family transcriptional regulator
MNWIFPKIKTKNDVPQQVVKIGAEIAELNEVFECYRNLKEEGLADDNDLLAAVSKSDEEAVDVFHAAETLIRIKFAGREKELDRVIAAVVEKNKKRGYYE